jgi:hypothetical protein
MVLVLGVRDLHLAGKGLRQQAFTVKGVQGLKDQLFQLVFQDRIPDSGGIRLGIVKKWGAEDKVRGWK